MKQNLGSVDRIIRVLLGMGMLSLVFFGPHSPWGWIGVVPIATALMGWCPPYQLLGINTSCSAPKECCSSKHSKHDKDDD